jgi:hypothetical protein
MKKFGIFCKITLFKSFRQLDKYLNVKERFFVRLTIVAILTQFFFNVFFFFTFALKCS